MATASNTRTWALFLQSLVGHLGRQELLTTPTGGHYSLRIVLPQTPGPGLSPGAAADQTKHLISPGLTFLLELRFRMDKPWGLLHAKQEQVLFFRASKVGRGP